MSSNSNGIYLNTGTYTIVGNVFYGTSISTYEPPKCELCKEDVLKGKFIELNLGEYLGDNNLVADIPKNLLFHFPCFIDNIDKLKNFIILEEMLK